MWQHNKLFLLNHRPFASLLLLCRIQQVWAKDTWNKILFCLKNIDYCLHFKKANSLCNRWYSRWKQLSHIGNNTIIKYHWLWFQYASTSKINGAIPHMVCLVIVLKLLLNKIWISITSEWFQLLYSSASAHKTFKYNWLRLLNFWNINRHLIYWATQIVFNIHVKTSEMITPWQEGQDYSLNGLLCSQSCEH